MAKSRKRIKIKRRITLWQCELGYVTCNYCLQIITKIKPFLSFYQAKIETKSGVNGWNERVVENA